MKTTKKALLLALCAVLLVVSTVFATMAYLTAQTDVVRNTFTVGKVSIVLNEAPVTPYGEVKEGEDRVIKNTYKLIPGHEYVKDPTVYVDAASERCYVFVEVVNNISDIEDLTAKGGSISGQMSKLGWVQIQGTKIWYYNAAVDPSVDTDLELEVFETFTLKGDADISSYDSDTNPDSFISIKAYAVQADGFKDAEAAWNATFGA